MVGQHPVWIMCSWWAAPWNPWVGAMTDQPWDHPGLTDQFHWRYLKFADYMANGIYAHRWVGVPADLWGSPGWAARDGGHPGFGCIIRFAASRCSLLFISTNQPQQKSNWYITGFVEVFYLMAQPCSTCDGQRRAFCKVWTDTWAGSIHGWLGKKQMVLCQVIACNCYSAQVEGIIGYSIPSRGAHSLKGVRVDSLLTCRYRTL